MKQIRKRDQGVKTRKDFTVCDMLQRINKALTNVIIDRMNKYVTPKGNQLNDNLLKKEVRVKGKGKQKIYYYDLPIAFDIETSSFKINGEKYSLAYMWMMKIMGICVYGRRLEEFVEFMNDIAEGIGLEHGKKHIIIYVHFLGFEFQFIRKYFKWDEKRVICNSARSVITACTDTGIEFRCSYMLSGVSLEQLAKELTEKRMRKSKDLDYSLIRHYKTPLTKKEMKYCELDVKILYQYVYEKMKYHHGILNIPLTKTGYPRKSLRKRYTGYGYDSDNYRKAMKDLNLEVDEYEDSKSAFMGGFTFSGMQARGRVVSNVVSYDINSAYPYIMFTGYYPISNATVINSPSMEQVRDLVKDKCVLLEVNIRGVKPKNPYLVYLMRHKLNIAGVCADTQPLFFENRLVSSGSNQWIKCTLTEIDFEQVLNLYSIDQLYISRATVFERKKLPRDMIMCLLEAYKNKTELKDVIGSELEYQLLKTILNAYFGMNVTDPCKIRDIYDTEDHLWKRCYGEGTEYETRDDYIKKKLTEYNMRNVKTLWYPIGVWICAQARRVLLNFLKSMGHLYIYSDTDCGKVKMLNGRPDQYIISQLNLRVLKELKQACDYYGISMEMVSPEDTNKKVRILGMWEQDAVYKVFKTLGPKRYMSVNFSKKEDVKILTDDEVEKVLNSKPKMNDLHTTVSGASPKNLPRKFVKECKTYKECFNRFRYGLHVEEEYTGKQVHTYIDEEQEGVVTDYRGTECAFHTLSGIYLEPASYDMKSPNEVDFETVFNEVVSSDMIF